MSKRLTSNDVLMAVVYAAQEAPNVIAREERSSEYTEGAKRGVLLLTSLMTEKLKEE